MKFWRSTPREPQPPILVITIEEIMDDLLYRA